MILWERYDLFAPRMVWQKYISATRDKIYTRPKRILGHRSNLASTELTSYTLLTLGNGSLDFWFLLKTTLKYWLKHKMMDLDFS